MEDAIKILPNPEEIIQKGQGVFFLYWQNKARRGWRFIPAVC
tara:strand:+ start:331 stop:456 length:126 start_codon:yes stop_codon:yes gene_type:complete